MNENLPNIEQRYAIAVDLGGTKVAVAMVDAGGEIRHKRKSAVIKDDLGATADQIASLATQALKAVSLNWSDVVGIGVCIPGIYFAADGTVWAPNVWGDQRVALREALRQRMVADVVLDSDRAAYVTGEQWRGVAQGLTDVVFVAVGTGIGAGIITGGQLCRGAGDIAGAVGWFALGSYRNEPDTRTGAFEYEAAGPALARKARNRIEAGAESALRNVDATAITTELVVRSALQGDELALSILGETASYLGMGIANIISILNPQVVVLGGGLMNAGEYVLDRIRHETRRWAQPMAAKQCRIELTSLGDDAGVLGAARLAFLHRNN
jgi:glucokinase